MGSQPRVFFEVRELAELTQRRAGERTLRRTSERGYSVETDRDGELDARWTTVAQEADLAPLPADVRAKAEETLRAVQPPPVEALEDGLNTLSAHAQALGSQLQLGLRETDQRVVCATGASARTDHRRDLVLELKLTVTRDGRSASLQRERAYLNGEAFTAAGPALRTLLEEMQTQATQRLDAVAAPSGPLTLVLPPGADAGVFFHEVCGHPLEGDVVARGASYLAQRLGQRVAEPFVEVRDDPTLSTGVSFTLDDEGTPAAPARLIAGGEVRDALLDASAASPFPRKRHGVTKGPTWPSSISWPTTM
jgi:TldD protein